MKLAIRGVILFIGLICLWQGLVSIFHLPSYILPTPWAVFKTAYLRADIILMEAIPTLTEAVMGLLLGIVFGSLAAVTMAYFGSLRLWILPLLIISQAIPTFAIAPLLVIWFGYGMTSKIITTMIMVFFPITNALLDGLRRTDKGWLDLAKTMRVKKWRIFWHIRLPAALPQLASGMRVATTIAPIGAIVGEWVGASQGLGFLMLNANARMQIDLMFAALFAIVFFSLILYFIVDNFLRICIWWQAET